MKKGFTLIELMGTITVLAFVVTIATRSIISVIEDYNNQMYEEQLQNIETASKNWVAANIEKVTGENITTYVTLKELKDSGVIDKNLKNPKGGTFSNLVFVAIKCEKKKSNYKFTYNVIDTTENMLIYLADNNFKKEDFPINLDSTSENGITLLELLPEHVKKSSSGEDLIEGFVDILTDKQILNVNIRFEEDKYLVELS